MNDLVLAEREQAFQRVESLEYKATLLESEGQIIQAGDCRRSAQIIKILFGDE